MMLEREIMLKDAACMYWDKPGKTMCAFYIELFLFEDDQFSKSSQCRYYRVYVKFESDL